MSQRGKSTVGLGTLSTATLGIAALLAWFLASCGAMRCAGQWHDAGGAASNQLWPLSNAWTWGGQLTYVISNYPHGTTNNYTNSVNEPRFMATDLCVVAREYMLTNWSRNSNYTISTQRWISYLKMQYTTSPIIETFTWYPVRAWVEEIDWGDTNWDGYSEPYPMVTNYYTNATITATLTNTPTPTNIYLGPREMVAYECFQGIAERWYAVLGLAWGSNMLITPPQLYTELRANLQQQKAALKFLLTNEMNYPHFCSPFLLTNGTFDGYYAEAGKPSPYTIYAGRTNADITNSMDGSWVSCTNYGVSNWFDGYTNIFPGSTEAVATLYYRLPAPDPYSNLLLRTVGGVEVWGYTNIVAATNYIFAGGMEVWRHTTNVYQPSTQFMNGSTSEVVVPAISQALPRPPLIANSLTNFLTNLDLPPNFLDVTFWEQLNGMGVPQQRVYTCEWTFAEARTNPIVVLPISALDTMNHLAPEDFHRETADNRHQFSGIYTQGQKASMVLTNYNIAEGSRSNGAPWSTLDYGWEGIRKIVNALTHTAQLVPWVYHDDPGGITNIAVGSGESYYETGSFYAARTAAETTLHVLSGMAEYYGLITDYGAPADFDIASGRPYYMTKLYSTRYSPASPWIWRALVVRSRGRVGAAGPLTLTNLHYRPEASIYFRVGPVDGTTNAPERTGSMNAYLHNTVDTTNDMGDGPLIFSTNFVRQGVASVTNSGATGGVWFAFGSTDILASVAGWPVEPATNTVFPVRLDMAGCNTNCVNRWQTNDFPGARMGYQVLTGAYLHLDWSGTNCFRYRRNQGAP